MMRLVMIGFLGSLTLWLLLAGGELPRRLTLSLHDGDRGYDLHRQSCATTTMRPHYRQRRRDQSRYCLIQ